MLDQNISSGQSQNLSLTELRDLIKQKEREERENKEKKLSNYYKNIINEYKESPNPNTKQKLINAFMDELNLYHGNILSYTKANGIKKFIILYSRNIIKNLLNRIFDENNNDFNISQITDITFNVMINDDINDFDISQITDIDFTVIIKDGCDDGSFFPYTNDSIFDLEKFKIFNKDNIDFKKHGLIEAFEQSEQFTENQISDILELLTGLSISKTRLKQIAEKLNCTIQLRYFEPDQINTTTITYNKLENNKEIKLALYKGHYFIDCIVKFHRWAIRNQDSPLIKKDKKWKQIRSLKSNGDPSYSKKYKMSSLIFIDELFKQGSLKPINFIVLDLSKELKK